jgi:hypothetical protein
MPHFVNSPFVPNINVPLVCDVNLFPTQRTITPSFVPIIHGNKGETLTNGVLVFCRINKTYLSTTSIRWPQRKTTVPAVQIPYLPSEA